MTDLLETTEDGIAWLTLNRPDRLNALSPAMLSGLGEAKASRVPEASRQRPEEIADVPDPAVRRGWLAPFIAAAVLVSLGFLLVAHGWKEHQLHKIDFGGSSTEAYTLEQNLERIPILEAGLRLAPRNDALHVELGRTHLRIYEQNASGVIEASQVLSNSHPLQASNFSVRSFQFDPLVRPRLQPFLGTRPRNYNHARPVRWF